MGVDRGVGLALVVAVTALASGAEAQSGPVAPADPRAASKLPTRPPPPPAYPQAPASGAPQAPVPPYSQPTYSSPRAPETTAGYPPGATAQPPRLILAPPVLPYREGAEPPQGYVLSSHSNHGLLLGGGLTWVATYAGGLVYAMGKSFDNGTGWLALPVVGPWASIGNRDFQCRSSSNVTQRDIDTCVDGALQEVTSITLLAMLGLVQAVGATMFFVGLGDTTEEWVRADLANVQLQLTPGQLGESGHGLNLSGRF